MTQNPVTGRRSLVLVALVLICAASSRGDPQPQKIPLRIHMVNGMDHTEWAQFRTLGEHLAELGIGKVHYHRIHEAPSLSRLLDTQRDRSPEPVVLVGYSLGANVVTRLAAEAAADGQPVALLVYIDAVFLPPDGAARSHAQRVVHIAGDRRLWHTPHQTAAQEVRLNGVGHYAIPCHPTTFDVLTKELNQLLQPPARANSFNPSTRPLVEGVSASGHPAIDASNRRSPFNPVDHR